MQKKTQRAVQFEVTEQTRDALTTWIATAQVKPEQFLFPARWFGEQATTRTLPQAKPAAQG